MKVTKFLTRAAILCSENCFSASFDCSKADTAIEKMICSNAKVSALDSELDKKFDAATFNEKIRTEIVKDQIIWLMKTREKCEDIKCLEEIYRKRIDYIESQASQNPAEEEFLLSTYAGEPEASLGTDAEVVLVSGYEPEGDSATINVDRPGSNVILVLSSYESILWKVHVTPTTKINAILVGGYKTQQVSSNIKVPLFTVKIPYAYEEDNINFKKILIEINRLLAINHVDYFNGNYRVPQSASVQTINKSNRNKLSLDWPATAKPIKNFSFQLLDVNNQPVEWTLTGPKVSTKNTYVQRGTVVSPKDGSIYKLRSGKIEKFNQTGTKLSTSVPPESLPRISWDTDITYDTKRNLLSLITLGGEGYLYRYHPGKNVWLDAHSAQNNDINSIFYDKKLDRYMGWAGGLVVFNGDGDYLYSKPITEKLEGYGTLYDRNNGAAAPLKIIASGDAIALIAFSSGNVTHIWNYDVASDKAALTYKASLAYDDESNSRPHSVRW